MDYCFLFASNLTSTSGIRIRGIDKILKRSLLSCRCIQVVFDLPELGFIRKVNSVETYGIVLNYVRISSVTKADPRLGDVGKNHPIAGIAFTRRINNGKNTKHRKQIISLSYINKGRCQVSKCLFCSAGQAGLACNFYNPPPELIFLKRFNMVRFLSRSWIFFILAQLRVFILSSIE